MSGAGKAGLAAGAGLVLVYSLMAVARAVAWWRRPATAPGPASPVLC
jgi:hypothetical protein